MSGGVQGPTHPCACGEQATVTATESPYEFHADCEHCGRSMTLSWRHSEPPPRFEPGAQTRLPFRSEER